MTSSPVARERRTFNTVLIAAVLIGVIGGPILAIQTGQPWWIFLAEIVIAATLGIWNASIRRRAQQP